jgi:predicted RNase H-like HicB family nuclease
MKVTVVIEQNSKGRYSAYISDKRIKFGVLGEGKTVDETIEDFKIGYEEIKETYQSEAKEFPELEFDFRYDIASFLSAYSGILSLAGMSRLTGLNQGLLSHYVTGRKKPTKKTVSKISDAVHRFGESLHQINFI